MSSSSPRTKPSIDPPSKVTFPSSAASNSVTGTETFLATPSTSAKERRTNRTSRSLDRRKTSRLLRVALVCECIDRHCHSKSELVVRIVQFAGANLADLPQTVENRVAVHVELFRGGLDVFADAEIQPKRAFEFGLVFFVVYAQRRQRARRKFSELRGVGTGKQERICAQLVVHADSPCAVDSARDRQRIASLPGRAMQVGERDARTHAAADAQVRVLLRKSAREQRSCGARVGRIDLTRGGHEEKEGRAPFEQSGIGVRGAIRLQCRIAKRVPASSRGLLFAYFRFQRDRDVMRCRRDSARGGVIARRCGIDVRLRHQAFPKSPPPARLIPLLARELDGHCTCRQSYEVLDRIEIASPNTESCPSRFSPTVIGSVRPLRRFCSGAYALDPGCPTDARTVLGKSALPDAAKCRHRSSSTRTPTRAWRARRSASALEPPPVAATRESSSANATSSSGVIRCSSAKMFRHFVCRPACCSSSFWARSTKGAPTPLRCTTAAAD